MLHNMLNYVIILLSWWSSARGNDGRLFLPYLKRRGCLLWQ